MKTCGIHHVTGITGDAQANIDFYTGTLGLRMVKLTVNFDDPSAYHLYYGNALGSPGTIMTFFHWPTIRPRQDGTGEISAVSFSIPEGAVSYWEKRLSKNAVSYTQSRHFDEERITFRDPDGLELSLIAEKNTADVKPWTFDVPEKYAIRAIHSVTLCEDGSERMRNFLRSHFGYRQTGEEDGTFRFAAEGDAAGRHLFVRLAPDLPRGSMGAGTVHHVAFRAKNDADEFEMRRELLEIGMDATPVIDRNYFHSVYFREPGGVLFEIATDHPGFAIDEPRDSLGSSLILPAQFEAHREEIVRALPKVKLPSYD